MGGGRPNRLIPGARYGMLVYVRRNKALSPSGHLTGVFQCDCGGRAIKPLSRVVHGGASLDCGCQRKGRARASAVKHGGKGTKEYRQWSGAKTRCFNSRSKDWKRYGERGVTMCPRWANSFGLFLQDMGKCPEGLSLDRIDPNGNYEPSNCRWATIFEQVNNRRNSIRVEFREKNRLLGEIAGLLNISHDAAYMRYKRGKLYE